LYGIASLPITCSNLQESFYLGFSASDVSEINAQTLEQGLTENVKKVQCRLKKLAVVLVENIGKANDGEKCTGGQCTM